METLASGYGLIEGPRADADGNLYWSDVTHGGVYRRSPDGEITTVVPKRRGVGGIVLHADGGIVVSGRNICHVKDGESRVLFARDDIPGFNDISTDGRGRVFAGSIRTDPFGEEARTPGELYRIDAEGQATELYADVGLSNGIGFSPDGRRLYHSDSSARHVLVSDVATDGTVTDTRPLIQPERGVPDGLAVDLAGGIWVALYGAGVVARFTHDGEPDRVVEVPATAVTSLCFGATDPHDLFIVTADNTEDPGRAGTVFRTHGDIAGLAVAPAHV